MFPFSVLRVSIMDSNFVQKLQNIKLTEDEGVVIRVGTVHRDRILEECSLSLLGRFLTNRPFNQRAAKALLRSVWKIGSDVRIVDVGDGVFQFKFSMESQLKWVLANGLWSFEDQPLVLCRWERGMTAASIRFTSIPMWIQVWGLPFDLLSEDVGRDIGNGLGKVVEVDLKAFSLDQARFYVLELNCRWRNRYVEVGLLQVLKEIRFVLALNTKD